MLLLANRFASSPRAFFALLFAGLVVYFFVLVELLLDSPGDWLTWLYAVIGIGLVRAVWFSTYVYEIRSDSLIQRPLFGLLPVVRVPFSELRAFRERPDHEGALSPLEVESTTRLIQLHRYQRNFHVGVSLLLEQNPAVPVAILSKWAL